MSTEGVICTCSQKGMLPRGWQGIHSYREPVSHCRVDVADKEGAEGCEVLSGAAHSIARHKWQPKVELTENESADQKREEIISLCYEANRKEQRFFSLFFFNSNDNVSRARRKIYSSNLP